MERYSAEYQEQYQRIALIGRQVGMGILGDVDAHPGTPASVPFMTPLPLDDFRDEIMPTGRYYYPLAETEAAFDIYNRIVNVPCHPGMKSLSDSEIKTSLENLIQRCFKS